MTQNNGHQPEQALPQAAQPVGVAAVAGATSADTSESELAAMVGLPSTSAKQTQEAGTEVASSDLLDDDDLDDDEDNDGGKSDNIGKTKTPLWGNPFIKVLFVAGFAGIAFLTVALVFGALQTATQRDGEPEVELADSDTEAEAVDPIAAAMQRQQEEIGQLKTQNALGNQQQALALQGTRQAVDPSEVLALRNRQLDVIESVQEQAGQGEVEPVVASPERPTPPATPPRPTPVARSTAPPPRPVPPAPRPAPVATPMPPPAPRSPAAPVAPVDPQEQWDTLARLGSYGQGSYVAEVPPAPGTETAVTAASEPSEVAPAPDIAAEPAMPSLSPDASSFADASEMPELLPESMPNPVEALPAALKANAATTYAQEEAAILGHTLKTLQAGTFAPARLVTPIYWAQDLANEQQSQRTALELTEPLYAEDGSVALAEGTLLVAEVRVIAGSGLLELQITDVVTLNDGVQRTMQLPNQNMVIAGSDGNPLIAREIESDGGIRAAEMQLAALGALGNVGELLNRPDSATTVIGNDTSVSTVENGSVNVLAGLLQGAVDAVLPIEQERIANRIDDINDRPRIWFHDADAEVLVFVRDEFTFRLD